MNNKQQVLHIHGGEPFAKYEDYLENLKSGRCDPYFDSGFRWAKNYNKFLDENLYEILIPQMPCQQNAHYNEWKIWFERHIPFLREGIILVGHSLGGNFLAKYLAEENFEIQIKQLHLVAPSHSAFEDDFKIGEFPGKLLEKNIPKIHIYHSTDDTVVPISESETYHQQIPGSELHVFSDRFHFLDETFPELFENIKK